MNLDNVVGNTLGNRYEVLEKIGSGGMASVFKAKDTLLNRLVAIKILKEGIDVDDKMGANFIKEAQSAASLSHSNIVSVYDVGEDDGINYMVMELVDGITLKEYIKKTGALEWQEACDFALQIGQGIGEAHASNIIHRDIKPQNIIMTKDKLLKVTDFGIARVAAGETTIVGGTALGSVHYISPEQARGSHTDERSDIYSLGIVLYEMLTGKVPFDGETPVSVALMHLEKEPVNVRCVNMDIPASLAHVTMKAIEKEPFKRYSNIQEFLDDIHAVLAEEPLPSFDGLDIEDDTPSVVDDEDEVDYRATFDDEEPIEEESEKKKRKKNRVKKSAKQKKEDRLAVILAFATIIAIALIGFGAYKIVSSTKGSYVPDLANMTVEEATAELEKVSLRLNDEIEYTISDTVEEGRVVTHDPAAHEFIAKGGKVKLVVSIGSSGGDISVPSVEGDEFNEAITKILDAGLNYVVVEEESDTVEANRVIRQLPVAGTKLNADDIVTLHVSKGADNVATEAPAIVSKVPVPNVVGMSKEDAVTLIEGAQLVVSSVNRQYSDSSEGLVIEQSPQYPASVAPGSGVSIIISKGPRPEETPVPDEPETPVDNNNNSGGEAVAGGNEGTSNGGNEVSAPQKTKTFTVKIPESSGDTVYIEITANGEVVHSAEHNKSEGYVAVDIPGTSGTVSVQAMIDGSLAAQRTLNFD